MTKKINIEVAYALPGKQKIIKLSILEGTTAMEAVRESGINLEFPDLDLGTAKLGIFGKAIRSPSSEAPREGDRIEIYRPLLIDPKQARANRAAKNAKDKGAKPSLEK